MPRLISHAAFGLACLAAALAPLVRGPQPSPRLAAPAWPAEFEGRSWTRVPLSPVEERFNRTFPGEVAAFTDGTRQYLCRWIWRPTRRLHASADCFRGLGYEVTAESPVQDAQGRRWSRFTAEQSVHRVTVRERIVDTASGKAWTDVSAWYWSVWLQRQGGPWLAISIVENP